MTPARSSGSQCGAVEPDSVAKTISCPAFVSSRHGTAVSVTSKSRSGSGIKTRAIECSFLPGTLDSVLLDLRDQRTTSDAQNLRLLDCESLHLMHLAISPSMVSAFESPLPSPSNRRERRMSGV